MNSFHLDKNARHDGILIPKSVGTIRIGDDGVPPWSQLPGPVIEKIYSYLNRRDQSSMSAVCRNWRQEYSSPSLWRRIEFRSPVPRNDTELCPGVIFARRYGTMFHHVEVNFGLLVFRRPASVLASVRQIKMFCEAVARNSQLLSISFRYVEELSRSFLREVFPAILNLLKSQNRLRQVEFSDCLFEKAQAAEILNVTFANNFKTLRYMYLIYFYDRRRDKEYTESTVNEDVSFLVLMKLEKLYMDYSLMFVNIMLSFYEYRNRLDMTEKRGCLKLIKLFASYSVLLHYVRIHPLAWTYFRNIFPGLSVELTLNSDCDPRGLDIFLVPHMPLRSLKFVLNLSSDQGEELGSMLRHITSCNLNESLEELTVVWQTVSSNLAPDLISFTSVCSKLKSLDIEIEGSVEAEALDTVFNSWLENRPASLDVVNITIVANEENMIYAAHLNDIYAPLLRPMELKVSLF